MAEKNSSKGQMYITNMKNLKILMFTIAAFTFTAGCQKTAAESGVPNTLWYSKNPKAADFTISNTDELAGLAQIVNGSWGGEPKEDDFSGKTITLKKNINLSVYDNWVPIGYAVDLDFYLRDKKTNPFSGTLDGGGFIISNLTINRPDSSACQGPFGYISGAAVKNLALDNVNISGGNHVGTLAGIICCGSVTNSYSTGTVSGARRVKTEQPGINAAE